MLFMFQSLSKTRWKPVKWSWADDGRVQIAVENETSTLDVVDWLLNGGQECGSSGALWVVCIAHAVHD